MCIRDRVPFATRDELDEAIANSKEAFKTWRNSGQGLRMRVMLKFQELLRANTGKLAEMITREHGKTLPDAEGEVGRGLEAVSYTHLDVYKRQTLLRTTSPGAPARVPERLKGDGRYSFMEDSCVRQKLICLEGLDAKDTLQFPEESSFRKN